MKGLKPLQTKALLGTLLVLGSFISVCRAQCYTLPVVQGEGDSPPVCRDIDGTAHSINTKWINQDCTKCTCHKNKLECCGLITVPLQYDKSKCSTLFNITDCTYTVVMNKDNAEPCPFSVKIRDGFKEFQRNLLSIPKTIYPCW